MYENFFKNNFIAIRGATSIDRRNEIINRMIKNFTMHVLSELHFDDYVIPNYVKRILEDYTMVYMDAINPEYDYVKVYFPDFDINFDERTPVEIKARELGQEIKKNAKISHVILTDEEIDAENKEELKGIFLPDENEEAVDLLIVDKGYSGGDIFVRDKYSMYLIHRFYSMDNDIYSAIKDSNRHITEFFAKIVCDYNTSFFL